MKGEENIPVQYSEHFESATRSFARDFFASFEQKEYLDISAHDLYDTIMTDLARIATGRETPWRKAYGTDEFCAAAKIFLQELARFAHNHVRTRGHSRMQKIGSERMGNMVIKLEQALFTMSPNILNALDVAGRFEIAALFGRTPELDGRPYEECLATLTEILTFGDDGSEDILQQQLEKILQKTAVDQLAFVDVMERLILLSFGQGYDHDANVYERCSAMIAACAQQTRYPIVKASAQHAARRGRGEGQGAQQQQAARVPRGWLAFRDRSGGLEFPQHPSIILQRSTSRSVVQMGSFFGRSRAWSFENRNVTEQNSPTLQCIHAPHSLVMCAVRWNVGLLLL